mgnify:CR=1 FL=1
MPDRSKREGRCRLCDSALCTSKLCCETGQEVVLCLLRSQDGYRRKYTECICGEEDHVLSCRTCGDRANDIFNMVDRIGYTGVLGYALVSEVDHTVFIKCYVLEKSITDRRKSGPDGDCVGGISEGL